MVSDLKCFISNCLRFGPKPSMPSSWEEKNFLDRSWRWKSDGETVDFILDQLEEEKFLQGSREFDDLRITEEQFMGLVLVILLQTCNGNI